MTVRKLWTIDDVADYLGFPAQTIYQWRTRNYGPPGARVSKHVRFRSADVEEWLCERITAGAVS